MEAALMQAVHSTAEFRAWFAKFLPRAADGEPAILFSPAFVTDRTDGQIAHLDGLNLSRAWCWRLIMDKLAGGDRLRQLIRAAIDAHLASALDHIAGDYMGEHWLASFATLALDPYAVDPVPGDAAARIETSRLVLRRMTMDDAPVLHEIFDDPEAMAYWSTPPHADLAQTRGFMARTIAGVESGEADDFAVEFEGRVVGKAGLWSGNELGFIFSRDVWGKGIAREAISAVLTRAFANGVETVMADADPRNARCIALLEKLGFFKTGEAKATYKIGDIWTDSVYLEKIRPS
jgi:RimJ/RimL family protein N-acetyltransferase